ncbi:MAG: LysR substrate-binding domain-containing protein [Pseudomonadota bacterium]
MDEYIDGQLGDLALLVRVVESGGFTAASRRTGTPQSTISRRIAALERRLGQTLLSRTTRRLELTEPGQRVFDHAKQMLAHAEAAQGAMAELLSDPSGLLRVTAPLVLGQALLTETISRFLADHPAIRLTLEWTARAIDPVEDAVDVAIRVGKPRDSAAMMVTLGSVRSCLYAPGNWAGPVPRHPDDLAGHPVFGLGRAGASDSLRFVRGRERADVAVTWRLQANDTGPVIAAAEACAGLAVLPSFVIPTGWSRLLADWQMTPMPVNALTARGRGSLPRVRLFLQALQETFANFSKQDAR